MSVTVESDNAQAQSHARATRGMSLGRWLLVATAVLAVAAPFMASRYWLFLLTSMFAYAIAVLGLKVLFGDCGQLSLGQGAFVGIGAYAAAILTQRVGLTLPYEILGVAVVSTVIALLVAVPALRVSGLRFAIVTLAFGQLFQWFLREQKGLTGGEQGLFTPAMLLGSVNGRDPIVLYFITGAAAAVVTVIVWRLPRTQIGRAMAAVRESPMAATSVGVSVWRTKLFAFVFASVAAAIGGMFLAHVQGSISPTTFDLFSSVYLLVALILGGARSALGPWIGAAYLVAIPALFTAIGLDRVYVLLSGAVLLVVIMLFPAGVAGILQSLVRRIEGRRA